MNIRDVVKIRTRFSLSLSLAHSLTHSLSLARSLSCLLTHTLSLSLCEEVGQQMVLAVITLTFTNLTPHVLDFSKLHADLFATAALSLYSSPVPFCFLKYKHKINELLKK